MINFLAQGFFNYTIFNFDMLYKEYALLYKSKTEKCNPWVKNNIPPFCIISRFYINPFYAPVFDLLINVFSAQKPGIRFCFGLRQLWGPKIKSLFWKYYLRMKSRHCFIGARNAQIISQNNQFF